MAKEKSIFDDFTRKYALSKTLRFELKPVGKTLENMREHLRYDAKLQTFLSDQEIEDAYQTLKPVLDFLHEKYINESLESKTLKEVDFSSYLKKYRDRKKLSEKDFEPVCKELREYFKKAFEDTAEGWKTSAGKDKKDKPLLSEDGFKILTEKNILEYIRRNVDTFASLRSKEEIEEALKAFEGFFTYFGGFNKNRENYYETGKEAATAVATRVVHKNLPGFCDNILFFEDKKEDYKGIHSYLGKLGKNLVTKDGKPLVPISENYFRTQHFNSCLSQTGIEQYNGEVIGNANFLINLYNQSRGGEKGFKKLSLFKTLYKQIGCGKRVSLFFTLTHDTKAEAEKDRKEKKSDAFSVEEILDLAEKAGEKYFRGKSDDGTINTVSELLENISSRENYEGVYWSKIALNTISNRYLANWHQIKDKLKDAKIFKQKGKSLEDDIQIPDAIELERLFEVIDSVQGWEKKDIFFKPSLTEEKKDVHEEKKNKKRRQIIANAGKPSRALLKLLFLDIEDHAENFLAQTKIVRQIQKYKDPKSKETIKLWMDHALAVSQMLKYFLVRENKAKGAPLDATIVEALKTILRSDDVDWFGWYDALRNYLTKKPQDDAKENKLKLNFENSTLAGGWDVNKEPDNYCVIFQNSENEQFIGIIAHQENTRGYNKIFERTGNNPLFVEKSQWKKMEYKLLPGPNKMLPKCLLPTTDRKKYGASEEVLAIYDKGSFKKNENNFSPKDLSILIDFFKTAIKKYENWQCFDFAFRPTSQYEDISQFYSEVEKQGYKLDFFGIDKLYLEKLVNDGKVYLFQIKNQDYNDGKKKGHKNNLQTLYWEAVFKETENHPKLNGEAELFYRKPVPADKLVKVKNKEGKEIIKNFRFSKEKFLFHVPVTLNFCHKDNRISHLVNTKLVPKENLLFLGIDRGEKHLAFYSLVDKGGNIKEQGTLNIPFVDKDGKPRTIKAEKRSIKNGKEGVEVVECKDYNELLEARAGDRDYARKNWQTIGTIKELKDGYISQVVRKIVDIAVAHGAFIVLENLNIGFKRGRQKIEKSVYQKLELALAKKLNFLVDKNAEIGEVGSVTKALQLTPPVSNYGDIEGRNQIGIMLYTKADYTSQTDPVTGWRKSIYLKKGSEEDIKRQIADSFSDITFDGKDYCFIYTDKNTRKLWKLYSGESGKSLERFRREQNRNTGEWVSTPQDVTKNLSKLFTSFDLNKSLHSQIVDEGVELVKMDEHTAWESLRFTIEMIQQIRNTGVKKEDSDFILSPVRDENENHFDSRKAKSNEPDSGDANGAFNIARKGMIMNEHIKLGLGLYISDEEWDAWLAGKQVWGKWIIENGEKLKKKSRSL
ncbi:MAG: type V CRISPR-associated protein Cpf1 [Candidatus Taylorbacteria bacterium CG11_big_fil_rev_8_21_14_0_20_46_11]|uniref:Type V CRISPR-associated protein Cpf1 n=1 Tax=Candidatus Taylorbacteria bacterium CG11_big_fil_rev_8_21_14_0_20_46_11 TaxID=1975025 RepID=A0A2H0KCN3_9BACT|nr:MAG: type V CRISPR-associated protein Cpf1 [Candidatus Taylorbacteria bacterium CG11_big_fil_rev_8_21_14_0_20_46_11]